MLLSKNKLLQYWEPEAASLLPLANKVENIKAQASLGISITSRKKSLPMGGPSPWTVPRVPSMVRWASGVHTPNGISIDSAVYTGITLWTDRQTDRQNTLHV